MMFVARFGTKRKPILFWSYPICTSRLNTPLISISAFDGDSRQLDVTFLLGKAHVAKEESSLTRLGPAPVSSIAKDEVHNPFVSGNTTTS